MTTLLASLLQQIDLHPIRALPAAACVGWEPLRDHLRQVGILAWRPPLDEADAADVEFVDGEPYLTVVQDDLHARSLDIDFRATAVAIRRDSGITGPPLELLDARVVRIGAVPAKPYPCGVYLVRLLSDRNALDTLSAIKARHGAGRVIIMTPTLRFLSPETLRLIQPLGVTISPVAERIAGALPAPFRMLLDDLVSGQDAAPREDALRIDEIRSVAAFRGSELSLTPREFHALRELAGAAADRDPIVSRGAILDVLARYSTHGEEPRDEQVTLVISAIKKAIAAAASPEEKASDALIRTVRGVGYELRLPADRIWFRRSDARAE